MDEEYFSLARSKSYPVRCGNITIGHVYRSGAYGHPRRWVTSVGGGFHFRTKRAAKKWLQGFAQTHRPELLARVS
jgi:hypothetical protein